MAKQGFHPKPFHTQRTLKLLCLIALFNVLFSTHGCTGQKILWACDFSQRSLCGAINVTSQTMFQFGRGETPSEGTGPSGDHTLERIRLLQQYSQYSEYIFLEASWAGQEDTAVLRLPLVPIVEDVCLIFYYHMFSSNGWEQGNLKVTISQDSVSVWFVSGNKGPYWKRGEVTLPANTINIQFIAARGSGIQSDIALDDILLITGPCQRPSNTPAPPPLPPVATPSPLPNIDPVTMSPIPPLDPVTILPIPPFNPVTQAPIPSIDPVTPEPTADPQTPSSTPAPSVQPRPNSITPTSESESETQGSTTGESQGPCDPRYQYCPTPTTQTVAWMISPRDSLPTVQPNMIITKSTFDWDSSERNGLGFMITHVDGSHWSEVEESGQPVESSNIPNAKRWLQIHTNHGYGTSSVTSRFLQTTAAKGCLEYKALLAGQASLSVYLRQEGVPTAYRVHRHIGHPRYLGTIRLPVHDFMLTDIGFYISFKGEVQEVDDSVTIDDVTLYNDNC